MRIFVEDNAYSNRFPRTSELKRRFKIDDGGGEMGSAIERFKQEGRMEILVALVKKGAISYSEAIKMSGTTEDEFRKNYQEYLSDENEEH